MQYLYAGIWLLMGLVLMVYMGRKNKLYVFSGWIFLLMGIWWLLQAIFPHVPFFHGWMNWVVKIVLGLSLLLLCIIFFRERRSGGNGGQE